MGEATTQSKTSQLGRKQQKLNSERRVDWNRRCVFLVTTTKDGAALFDLDNDKFFKLDPIAMEMWMLFASGMQEDDIATSIANKCGVDAERVKQDFRHLINSAAEIGITPQCVQGREASLSEAPETTYQAFPWYAQAEDQAYPRPGFLTVMFALLALISFDFVLSTRSLKSICKLVSRWRVGTHKAASAELIGRICTSVERACVWYPKKALCLQRSAVTTCLLRRFGVFAKMVIGVRVMPMLSHAWVEVDGCVVNDHPKVKRMYQSLASF